MEEFQSMVQFFGEDPKKTTTTEIFGIFADFITKFEVNRYRFQCIILLLLVIKAVSVDYKSLFRGMSCVDL